jgi:hypothetical protein
VRVFAVIAAMSFISLVPAEADNFFITKTAQPYVTNVNGNSVDIVGVKLRMPVNEVIAVLRKQNYGEPHIEKRHWRGEYKGTSFVSQEFVWNISIYKGGLPEETISIQFTSPATGNVVKSVYREITYGIMTAHAMPRQPLIDGLYQKYGRILWNEFHGGYDQMTCAWDMKGKPSPYLNDPICTMAGPDIDQLEKMIRSCGSVVLTSQIDYNGPDRARMGSYTRFWLTDVMTSAIDYRALNKQIEEVGKRAREKDLNNAGKIKF